MPLKSTSPESQRQQEESLFHRPLAGRRPSLRIRVDIHDAPGAAGNGSSVSFTTREKAKDACGCLIIRRRASLRLRLEKFRSKSQNPPNTGYGNGHTLRLKPAGRRLNCAPGHKKVARHSLRARVPIREPDRGIGGRSCRHRSKIRRSSPLPEADCDPCRSLEEPRRGRRRFYAGNPEVRQFRASRGERSRSPFEIGSRPGWNNQAAGTVRARIITMCRSI